MLGRSAPAGSTERQQSAIEMLTTYSWVFLIIGLVVVVVILYGTSSPSQYIASQCSIQPLLPCKETILTAASGGSQIQFRALIVNNLAPYMYLPGNSLTITATNLGSYGTSNYTGTCSPVLAAKESQFICTANVPGSLQPSIGTSVTLTLYLKYQICQTFSTSNCPTAQYLSSGTAIQTLSKTSTQYYTLTLHSNVNTLISVQGQEYPSGTSILLPLGTYSAYALAPTGYGFTAWTSSSKISLTSTVNQNTSATLTGSGTLTANFISIVPATTTTPSGAPTSTTTVTATTTSIVYPYVGFSKNPILVGNTAVVTAYCNPADGAYCQLEQPQGTVLCGPSSGSCSFTTPTETTSKTITFFANDIWAVQTASANLIVVGNTIPILTISPNPITTAGDAILTATCNSLDVCAVDYPLGTHLCTGSGSCAYTISGLAVGNYLVYANDTNSLVATANVLTVNAI